MDAEGNTVRYLKLQVKMEHSISKLRGRSLRGSSWCVALALGAAQAWTTRFMMNPDGVSYLDIGDAYWRGDWHNAINSYWSPLYSWMLGFFLKIIRPSMYWEYPLVHLINFLIYAGSLAAFEYFLNTFIAYRRMRDDQLIPLRRAGLTETSWRLLGYSLFTATALLLISVGQPTPDMLVAGLFYLASALILKMRMGKSGITTYIGLGAVLGIAYLAKAVMFPLGFVFLATAFFAAGLSRRSAQNIVVAGLVFLSVASPFAAAISIQKEHLTFGESGAWNYAFYVNHVPYFVTDASGLKHPLRKISSAPPVYEFAEPVAGTFPPWYDPTYWHDGIKAHLTIQGEHEPIKNAIKEYAHDFFVLFLNVTVGFCILLFTGESLSQALARVARGWFLVVPALATLALYDLVHVESRFIGAPVTLLFLALYSGVSFPAIPARTRAASYTVALVAVSLLMMMIFGALVERQKMFGPVYPRAAAALEENGIGQGARIGLIWDEAWEASGAKGSFIPRLLRAKIVVEETDADNFWKLNAGVRQHTIEKMQAAGAQAILAYGVPSPYQDGWKGLRNTGYFAYLPSLSAESRLKPRCALLPTQAVLCAQQSPTR